MKQIGTKENVWYLKLESKKLFRYFPLPTVVSQFGYYNCQKGMESAKGKISSDFPMPRKYDDEDS